MIEAHSQNCEKRLFTSSCLSVRPHRTTQFPLDRFSWNFIFEYFFFKSIKKIQASFNLTGIMDTSHENQYTFMIISYSVFLRMRNVSDKNCRGNKNTLYVQ